MEYGFHREDIDMQQWSQGKDCLSQVRVLDPTFVTMHNPQEIQKDLVMQLYRAQYNA